MNGVYPPDRSLDVMDGTEHSRLTGVWLGGPVGLVELATRLRNAPRRLVSPAASAGISPLIAALQRRRDLRTLWPCLLARYEGACGSVFGGGAKRCRRLAAVGRPRGRSARDARSAVREMALIAQLPNHSIAVLKPFTLHLFTLHAVRMTEMNSVPLSGSHTSPGRPRIWRMLVPSRGKPKRSNFSVAGSKR